MSTASEARRSRAAIVWIGAPLLVIATAVAISVWGPRAALAVPVAGVAVATVFQPVVGLVALAVAIPMEDTVMVSGATLTKLLGVLVAGAWLLHAFVGRRSLKDIVSSPVVLLAVLFILFASASTLWAEYVAPTRGVLMRLVMFFALAVVALDLVRSRESATYVLRALVVGGLIAALLTIGQYYGLGVRRAGEGISGGVNATALILVTLVPFAFYLLRVDRGWWRLVALAYIGLAVGAVAVTFSRMSYLVLPMVLALELGQILRSNRGRIALAVLALASIPLVLKYVPVESVGSRLGTVVPYIESTVNRGPTVGEMSGRGFHLLVAWEIFEDHPIIGAGINNYGYQFLQYQHYVMGAGKLYTSPRSAHSSYFAILADLGIIGTILWLAFLAAVARALYVAYARSGRLPAPAARLLVRALSLAFAAQLVYGTYAEIHKEKLFWLIVGVATAVALMVQREFVSDAAPRQTARTGSATSTGGLVGAPAASAVAQLELSR
jgi:O-antigen ligase